MTRPSGWRRVIMLASASVVAASPVAAAPASFAAPEETWIVTLAGAGDPATVAARHARRFGVEVTTVYRSALHGYAARLSPQAWAALAADPAVAGLEPDRPLALQELAVPSGIDRVDAELARGAAIDEVPDPGVDVDVAVLDTGIDTHHPDLDVRGGVDCAEGHGYDDAYGHGTHIAGTIGALDDGVGVVGVAPGARLWSVRVLDGHGQGSLEQLLCGIDWVTSTRTDRDSDNDIEVANLSLSGPGSDDRDCGRTSDDALHGAICRAVAAGVVFVVAAGNDGLNSTGFSPSAYDEVITVSALADSDGRAGGLGGAPACRPDETDDSFASFSNHGPDVDLIAPGVCVHSTMPLDHPDGPYGARTGTSFAAPHVAGAAALYMARHPRATPAEVATVLIDAASPRWNSATDPDGIHEPLLDASRF